MNSTKQQRNCAIEPQDIPLGCFLCAFQLPSIERILGDFRDRRCHSPNFYSLLVKLLFGLALLLLHAVELVGYLMELTLKIGLNCLCSCFQPRVCLTLKVLDHAALQPRRVEVRHRDLELSSFELPLLRSRALFEGFNCFHGLRVAILNLKQVCFDPLHPNSILLQCSSEPLALEQGALLVQACLHCPYSFACWPWSIQCVCGQPIFAIFPALIVEAIEEVTLVLTDGFHLRSECLLIWAIAFIQAHLHQHPHRKIWKFNWYDLFAPLKCDLAEIGKILLDRPRHLP